MKKFLLTICLSIALTSLWAQSNPRPYTLSNADFEFLGFSDPDSHEYPYFMQGWAGKQVATDSTNGPTKLQAYGDYPLSTGADAVSLQQITNRGDGGISIQEGCDTSKNPFAIAIALDTRGSTGIKVEWIAYCQTDNLSGPNVLTYIALQYRIGTSGDWTNVAGHSYMADEGHNPATPKHKFGPTLLPAAIENQPEVQFRWVTWQVQQGVRYFCNGDQPGIDSIVFKPTTKTAQAPIANFKADNPNAGANEPVMFTDLSSGIPNYHHWDFGDGSVDSTSAQPVHTYTQNGLYTVTLIVRNAVGADTITKVNYMNIGGSPIGIKKYNPAIFELSPNPSLGKINIHLNHADVSDMKVEVYNSLGALAFSGNVNSNNTALDLSRLENGLYIVQLKTAAGYTYTQYTIISK